MCFLGDNFDKEEGGNKKKEETVRRRDIGLIKGELLLVMINKTQCTKWILSFDLMITLYLKKGERLSNIFFLCILINVIRNCMS